MENSNRIPGLRYAHTYIYTYTRSTGAGRRGWRGSIAADCRLASRRHLKFRFVNEVGVGLRGGRMIRGGGVRRLRENAVNADGE